jgi:hypothetical protein
LPCRRSRVRIPSAASRKRLQSEPFSGPPSSPELLSTRGLSEDRPRRAPSLTAKEADLQANSACVEPWSFCTPRRRPAVLTAVAASRSRERSGAVHLLVAQSEHWRELLRGHAPGPPEGGVRRRQETPASTGPRDSARCWAGLPVVVRSGSELGVRYNALVPRGKSRGGCSTRKGQRVSDPARASLALGKAFLGSCRGQCHRRAVVRASDSLNCGRPLARPSAVSTSRGRRSSLWAGHLAARVLDRRAGQRTGGREAGDAA